MKYYDDVKKFHDKFGMVTPPEYYHIPTDLYEFRVLFFNEELTEYIESHKAGDLATAIDSLIDLAYITCGAALLHGLGPEIFNDLGNPGVAFSICKTKPNLFSRDREPRLPPPPVLISEEDSNFLVQQIKISIGLYRTSYVKNDDVGIACALNGIFLNCICGAIAMGFDEPRWDVLWNDVQRANMAKERAVRTDQSKRGSTWDVFKPVGWVAPRTEELVKQMINGDEGFNV